MATQATTSARPLGKRSALWTTPDELPLSTRAGFSPEPMLEDVPVGSVLSFGEYDTARFIMLVPEEAAVPGDKLRCVGRLGGDVVFESLSTGCQLAVPALAVSSDLVDSRCKVRRTLASRAVSLQLLRAFWRESCDANGALGSVWPTVAAWGELRQDHFRAAMRPAAKVVRSLLRPLWRLAKVLLAFAAIAWGLAAVGAIVAYHMGCFCPGA